MQREQNYDNHVRIYPPFHFFFLGILFLTLLGSFVNFYASLGDHHRMYSASLICVLCFLLFFAGGFARLFAVRVQDRAIRAEENLRFFALTGKLLPKELKIAQIIALRFASDSEFVDMVLKAAKENTPPVEIKRSVKSWRADHDRV
jgi:hypothetical protein